MDAYDVGLTFPVGMGVERAVEIAKEAISEAGFESGSHSVSDVWEDAGKQYAAILLDVDHDVMHGRDHAIFRKEGVTAEIEMP